jgi:hypothetical protein
MHLLVSLFRSPFAWRKYLYLPYSSYLAKNILIKYSSNAFNNQHEFAELAYSSGHLTKANRLRYTGVIKPGTE